MLRLATAVLLLTTPSVRASQESHLYTATHGPLCIDQSRENVGRWSCPGPAGYIAEYFDEGNIAGITIRHRVHRQQAQASTSWRGTGRVFGDNLEWRLVGGIPDSAILRVWRTASEADGHESDVEELLVLKVSLAGACRVASVNARIMRANETARRMADDAVAMPCVAEP